ncbi:hypothetical protein [Conexibacter sp. SYSU D00693]|uniref:hypothetical protein n=1 Tax=Conexibacter sp. SYSU D00693 TaxID=2812560 RepID=UPI00196AE783|nr:hypothetical protein [Conexibacter sp. SYSU D00693]
MGFFKDIKQLKQTADAMTPQEYKGFGGGLRHMRDGVAQANQMLGGMAAEAQKAQTLMATGRVGSATVTALRDTGASINDNPVVELDLQVSLDGQEPYAVTHRQTIARLAVPGFQPGSTVPVRVDPSDKHSLIVA